MIVYLSQRLPLSYRCGMPGVPRLHVKLADGPLHCDQNSIK